MKKLRALSPAMLFILLFGIVSLFSDMTHEGAASIRGSYLSLLGASAAVIGFVSGLGELVGYSLRYVFGRLTDRTKKYWLMTIIGYVVDVLAVPALALVSENGWIFACALIIIERAGKAIKKPAKNTIMSFAASQEGAGKSFAIQEVLDQIGAFLGPVLLYIVMLFKTQGGTYKIYSVCFAALAIPAFITIAFLLYAKHKFPNPDEFEPEQKDIKRFRIKPSFILYIAAISLFAFGFIDFSIITMHVLNNSLFTADTLPLLYAGAMIVDAAAALIFGWMFDRYGFKALMLSTAVSAFFAVFIFAFHSVGMTILGVALWGVGMGAQESILKAAVSTMVPKKSRAAGYGIFECAFGLFWFLGSWLLGVLYDASMPALITVSVAAQLISIPLYGISANKMKKEQ
jgi:MFS family permease